MIPPHRAPSSDDERAKLGDVVTHAHHNYAEPPTPIRGLDHADTVLTGRNHWTQAAPIEEFAQGMVVGSEAVRRYVADQAAATANPLRDLVAELTRFADQLDAQGIVPLGIHACTAFDYAGGPYFDEDRRVAQVVTTVRGVRREWIDQHRTPVEASSGELPPRECACYGWTIADARNADWWGRQHHPKCDGTGQHKTEETPQP